MAALCAPGIGGLLGTEHNLFPEYDKGRFSAKNYDLILSAGIGGQLAAQRDGLGTVFEQPGGGLRYSALYLSLDFAHLCTGTRIYYEVYVFCEAVYGGAI